MHSYTIHKEVPTHMKYTLNTTQPSNSLWPTIKKFWPYLSHDRNNLLISLVLLLINSSLNISTPIIMGYTVDNFVQHKDFGGVLKMGALLLLIYVVMFVVSYFQTKIMGGVGQRLLFTLRNAIFAKLQELPLEFFSQNKAGDLISRINNDTDKLNQFFSQALMQFVGNLFIMTGAAIFILVLHVRLGAVALVPAVVILIFTQLVSEWVKKKNATNLQAVGAMSAEIQESLDNFKVIVAFNRRDYFKRKFQEVNQGNFKTAVTAGYANTIFPPIYGMAAQLALLLVLFYGTYLISQNDITIGVLISYLTYVTKFYDPIKQIGNLWSNFQIALAGWDRISEILALQSNLKVIASEGESRDNSPVLSFDEVSFQYTDGKDVLHNISFNLERGKTYALVGPTGGGKTTTASLMARLYDPTDGTILLSGKDIRSYTAEERTKKIGFILQEPFLFAGTVKDNILYGNQEYLTASTEEVTQLLHQHKLEKLLERFDQGLETVVGVGGESISLGQRQLLAFMRIALRDPDLLILDEATANVDTVTEQLLNDILNTLPKHTTKVIIAHRLNTIEDADEIFFVNAGEITRAGSLQHAIDLLLKQRRTS